MFNTVVSQIWSRRATPARTHLEGFSLVLRLNVQMYVWPEVMEICEYDPCMHSITSLPCLVHRALVQVPQLLLVLAQENR